MSEIERAIKDYLESEEIVQSSDAVINELKQDYENALRDNYGDTFSPQSATKVYEAFQKIEKHKNKIENSKIKMTQMAETIKKYLNVLSGKKISFSVRIENHRDISYQFFLDNDEVTHNKKKKD